MHLEKLFEEILIQLQSESKKYKKLKICKYSFEISKVAILSLATGLSFINIFAILSIILILQNIQQMLTKDYLCVN